MLGIIDFLFLIFAFICYCLMPIKQKKKSRPVFLYL